MAILALDVAIQKSFSLLQYLEGEQGALEGDAHQSTANNKYRGEVLLVFFQL